ncbi:MAG: VOC family protein [Actinomycetota bacterium]
MDLYKALRICPKVVVGNMDETVAFYCEVLGFTPELKTAGYSVLARDGQAIHFGIAASEEISKIVGEHTEMYMEVRGIKALWEHVKKYKDRYRIRDLFDREYGMTEFHIMDPNGFIVFVGEPTAQLG